MLARPEKGDRSRQDLGPAAHKGCKPRTSSHVLRQLDAVGLQDEQAPVATIVVGDGRLFFHDLVKARDLAETFGERQGFGTQRLPHSGERDARRKV
jgi:hypothetical protein